MSRCIRCSVERLGKSCNTCQYNIREKCECCGSEEQLYYDESGSKYCSDCLKEFFLDEWDWYLKENFRKVDD